MLLRRKSPPGRSPPVRGKGLNPVLYYLFYEQLFPYFSPFRVFRYLTFRTAFASITALLICLVLGPWLIARLKQFQIGQYIREEGPQSHQAKAGTPTMGGILIHVAILVPTLLWMDLRNSLVWLVILATLGFGLVGFLDDYYKLSRRQNRGLTGKTKLYLQILISFLVGIGLLVLTAQGSYSTHLSVPFFKQVNPDLLIHSLMGSPCNYPLLRTRLLQGSAWFTSTSCWYQSLQLRRM